MRTGTIRCGTVVGVPFDFFSGSVWTFLTVLLASSKTAETHPQRTKLSRYGSGFADCRSEDCFDFCKSVDLQGRLPHCQLLNLIAPLKLSACFLMTLLLLKYATLTRFCVHKLCSQGPGIKAACSCTGRKFSEVTNVSELALEQGPKPCCKACIGESSESNKEVMQ